MLSPSLTAAALYTYLAHRAATVGIAVDQLSGPLLVTASGAHLDQPCACREGRPRRLGSVLVYMKDAAESVTPTDVESADFTLTAFEIPAGWTSAEDDLTSVQEGVPYFGSAHTDHGPGALIVRFTLAVLKALKSGDVWTFDPEKDEGAGDERQGLPQDGQGRLLRAFRGDRRC